MKRLLNFLKRLFNRKPEIRYISREAFDRLSEEERNSETTIFFVREDVRIMEPTDVVELFIHKRFNNTNCDWNCGNCYYFAVILKDRFPSGEIYYDVVAGHFMLKFNDKYYDYYGRIPDQNPDTAIPWDTFDKYDAAQKDRIIRDCIL